MVSVSSLVCREEPKGGARARDSKSPWGATRIPVGPSCGHDCRGSRGPSTAPALAEKIAFLLTGFFFFFFFFFFAIGMAFIQHRSRVSWQAQSPSRARIAGAPACRSTSLRDASGFSRIRKPAETRNCTPSSMSIADDAGSRPKNEAADQRQSARATWSDPPPPPPPLHGVADRGLKDLMTRKGRVSRPGGFDGLWPAEGGGRSRFERQTLAPARTGFATPGMDRPRQRGPTRFEVRDWRLGALTASRHARGTPRGPTEGWPRTPGRSEAAASGGGGGFAFPAPWPPMGAGIGHRFYPAGSVAGLGRQSWWASRAQKTTIGPGQHLRHSCRSPPSAGHRRGPGWPRLGRGTPAVLLKASQGPGTPLDPGAPWGAPGRHDPMAGGLRGAASKGLGAPFSRRAFARRDARPGVHPPRGARRL